MTTLHAPTRRHLLLASGTLFAWAHVPKVARAEGRDPRFLAIILRGALDGLATVAPVGDPNWVSLRGDNALTMSGKTPALRLDDFFALNPAMPNLQRMFMANEAIIVHAAATSYRDRSHFEGQDVLESGLERPGGTPTGWLNRLLVGLAPERRPGSAAGSVFGVGPVTPLVVRGPAPVLSWSPRRILPASDDTIRRLVDLYHHTDPSFARALESRTKLGALTEAGGIEQKPNGPGKGPALAQLRAYFADAVGTAAKFLAEPDGPRIGGLALDGWDTHYNEGIGTGVLATLLGALDGALAAAQANLGPAWRETVVTLATEFGRTARINGTSGTDHGTGTVMVLAGGALTGGRVIADWPGLHPSNLFEDRDLAATTDVRAVLKGVLRDHLRADDRALAAEVFPGSYAAKPMDGLVAAT